MPTKSTKTKVTPAAAGCRADAACSPITAEELWALRQRVLNIGIGDPWDGEELEEGYVRPIPKGFEEEVAKFDAAHSQQIEEINAALDVISEMAMRQARWENTQDQTRPAK